MEFGLLKGTHSSRDMALDVFEPPRPKRVVTLTFVHSPPRPVYLPGQFCFSLHSSIVAAFLCCMLAALFRASASLRLPLRQALSSPPLTVRPATFPRIYGYLATRPHSTTMFKAAVKNHNGTGGASGAVKVTAQQQSLIGSFRHAPTTQSPTTRPLTTGSGNIGKHTASAVRRTPSKGIKRTSSGLAKALSSQDDFADYPTLNISDSENLPPSMMNPIGGGLSTNNAPVFFDADDFDSDIDLDVEDLATKDTIKYPKLPTPRLARPRDSGYASLDRDVQVKTEQDVQVKMENSSQPIPWSSSPLSHFMTPNAKVEPPPKKRRKLPWSQAPTQVNAAVEDIEDPEPEAETVRPKTRAPETIKCESTPLSKDPSKGLYPWNTTASAVKQQQKNLREQNKNLTTKVNDGTKEEVQVAISKKKKNTVYRIFLSEEQQHVLNLVVEFKKSVFFTGSAGRWQCGIDLGDC